ncbi:MAG: ATP-binding protein [Micrococcaceae bacterium]
MHRRLTAIYLTLLVVTTLGLAVPLSMAVVDRASHTLVLDRTADAARFSSLSENAVLTGQVDSTEAELSIYQQLYGIRAVVLDADARRIAASSPEVTLATVQAAAGIAPEHLETPDETVMTALAGLRQESATRMWPWSAKELLVAEPINTGDETVGVVVTSSPTTDLRYSILAQWLVIAVGVALTLVIGVWAARPLSQWVLRPVARLADAAQEISRGHLDARVSELHGPGELKHLAHAFNQMSTTITELLDRQRQFVAYASHQIRNPLAGVRLRVEALGASLPPERLPAHRAALEELDRLTRTCEGLLNLARAAEVDPEKVLVPLRAIALQRQRAWEPVASRRGARVEVDVPEGLTVRAVEHTLDQTLDVLIDNAVKFGGSGVTVTLRAHTLDDGAVELIVDDDGPGIPAELLELALVPFWRDPTARDAGGLDVAGGAGLGLSIVVTLLELDQGTLTLEPATPHGLRAVIRLPSGAAVLD